MITKPETGVWGKEIDDKKPQTQKKKREKRKKPQKAWRLCEQNKVSEGKPAVTPTARRLATTLLRHGVVDVANTITEDSKSSFVQNRLAWLARLFSNNNKKSFQNCDLRWDIEQVKRHADRLGAGRMFRMKYILRLVIH